MSVRAEKVASVLKKELAQPINDIVSEVGKGLVTLTSVRLSKDLSIAKVYLSLYGKDLTPGDVFDTLERRKGELRHILGSKIRLRITPDLKFFLDDTLDQMEHIQELLDSVKKDDN